MKRDILKEVNKLIKKYGTANPFTICQYLNIILVDNISFEGRGVYKYFQRNRIIGINPCLPEIERFITCAHELGHAVMHTKINTVLLKQTSYLKTNIYETEANMFSDYLMEVYFENN